MAGEGAPWHRLLISFEKLRASEISKRPDRELPRGGGGEQRSEDLDLGFPTQLESSHRKLRMLTVRLFHTVKSGQRVAFCPSVRPFVRFLGSSRSLKKL